MNARGVHVAGTSAGRAFLSEHMIAFGDEGRRRRARHVSLRSGLGVLTNACVSTSISASAIGSQITRPPSPNNPFAHGIGLERGHGGLSSVPKSLEVGSGAAHDDRGPPASSIPRWIRPS